MFYLVSISDTTNEFLHKDKTKIKLIIMIMMMSDDDNNNNDNNHHNTKKNNKINEFLQNP